LEASWTQKYRPCHLEDVVGNKDAISTLREWLVAWEGRPQKKKATLLYGPAGTGKTVTAEAASRDMHFDLVEMNASDKRTTAAIERIVRTAAEQSSLTARRRLILLDEVDGMDQSADRGAIEAISSTIEHTRWPILLTANDPWDPKLAPLRNLCLMIKFKRLGIRDSLPHLKKITTKEGLEIDEKALRFIIERNEGDMRSVLNDLQTLTAGRKRLAYEDVTWLGWRDRKSSIFEVLGAIFNAKTCAWARKAIELADVDYDMLFEWIYENAPTQLTDPKDRANALDALSKADLYMTRIRKTQDYGLLPYALDLMTAGVAVSRERTKPAWIKMSFPERIKLKGKVRRTKALREAIGRKIAAKCHTSTSGAVKDFLPYVKRIFTSNKKMAEQMSVWLNLDEEMIEYLNN
jgi:replication factor C large subunit